MVSRKVGVLVIGAGPTGLGAATRIHQHGINDWLLIDKADGPGGLSCTDVTEEGFMFDMGGHVKFSHYQYYDELLETAVGAQSDPRFWNTIDRVSYVWVRGTWVAYPFQNNLFVLPKTDQIACLVGLAEAKCEAATALSKPNNFDEWIIRGMGTGIANLFHRPYNFKAWATPAAQMQCEWLGDRASSPADFTCAISAFVNREEQAKRPRSVFRFPTTGGTGSIWNKVAKLLPAENQRYGGGFEVVGINKDAKVVTLANGDTIQYSALISTLPLDQTLRSVGRPDLAGGLSHSSTHVIGIGIRGVCPHGLKCWLYFPEDNCPFYRATIFSHYAQNHCPAADVTLRTLCMGDASDAPDSVHEAGPYWSLMFEVSESAFKPVNHQTVQLGGSDWISLVKETIVGALSTKLICAKDQIVSIFHRRLEYGYPTPTLGRDEVLAQALPWLQRQCIWSRGRFGSYKYEVGNQDHSLMLGVEAIDNILFGSKELTLNHPNIVNAQKNQDVFFASRTFLHHYTSEFGSPRRRSM